MPTWVSLLASVEPWISWSTVETQVDLLSAIAKSDGLVSDEEAMDDEGFLGL